MTPVATNRTFDPELSGYKYPREVRFFEFRDQDKIFAWRTWTRSRRAVATRKRCSCCTVRTSPAYWGPTIRELLKRGLRVVAPDQIGFGKSSKPHGYQFTFQALAQNTRALLSPSTSIGPMWWVIRWVDARNATRSDVPERTERLVLVNPIGLEDWKALGVPYRSIDENFAQELTMTPGSIREYERVSYFDGHWKPDYDPLIEILAGWSEDPEYPIVAWNAALTSDMIFTQPVLYEFPLVTARTLLIIGQRDRTAFAGPSVSASVRATLGHYPLLGRAAAQAIQHATLVEIAGVGHLPQIEAFDQYFEALAGFLTSDASQ